MPDTGMENVKDSHEHTEVPIYEANPRKKGAGQSTKKLHTGSTQRATRPKPIFKAVNQPERSRK